MPGRDRRLLIVEDEPLMASLLEGSLTNAGFIVTAAADVESGRRAVDTFDPDIVLLDISLGDGPTGVHLAHALRKTRPDIAVLILTKHPDAKSASREGLDLPPNVGFLRKHLVNDVTYLIDAIEKVLADQPQDVPSPPDSRDGAAARARLQQRRDCPALRPQHEVRRALDRPDLPRSRHHQGH